MSSIMKDIMINVTSCFLLIQENFANTKSDFFIVTRLQLLHDWEKANDFGIMKVIIILYKSRKRKVRVHCKYAFDKSVYKRTSRVS